MQDESTYQNRLISELFKGLKVAFIISMLFFLASIFDHDHSKWLTLFKINLGHGVSIYGMIWLSYELVAKLITWRENKTKKDINFDLLPSFLTSLIGLIVGSCLGELIRANILSKEINWNNLPSILVIGSFVSLMFIYRDQNKKRDQENVELSQINSKLQERRENKYIESVTINLGSSQRVIPIRDVLFFKSKVWIITHMLARKRQSKLLIFR